MQRRMHLSTWRQMDVLKYGNGEEAKKGASFVMETPYHIGKLTRMKLDESHHDEADFTYGFSGFDTSISPANISNPSIVQMRRETGPFGQSDIVKAEEERQS
ncbi:MAG: hypothetical protein Q9192_007509 [Flavoplaca navasiana]